MPVSFPNLQPTERSYSPGTYPQSVFTAQNGATTVVRFGSRRVEAELSLSFNNVSDSDAVSILQNYEAVNGVWDYVTFTSNDAAIGTSSELAEYMREVGGSGLRWRYSDAPSVTSVKPGLSSISCKFIGVLDGN